MHHALLSGDPHDQLGIAYHLVIDNKRIADEAAKAELKDFYVASTTSPVAYELTPSPIKPHPERIARKYSPVSCPGPSQGYILTLKKKTEFVWENVQSMTN